MESREHARLKHAVMGALRQAGCAVMATEVACPISKYRVDVAAYLDPLRTRTNERRRPAANVGLFPPALIDVPQTLIIECKACRSDFLREGHRFDRLLIERTRLDRDRLALEERVIRASEPDLCRADSLFPGHATWAFELSTLESYQGILRRLRRIDRLLHGDAKFATIARYRLADHMYIAALPGIISRHEVPMGWGLLEAAIPNSPPASARDAEECDGVDEAMSHETGSLRVVVESDFCAALELRRNRLLRNIAASSTRAAAVIQIRNGASSR